MFQSFRELLEQTRSEIREVSAAEVKQALERRSPLALLDVREPEEVARGAIPGSVAIPRGLLELRVELLVQDREAEVVAYCSGGARSALATRTLLQMGYRRTRSLCGGFSAWRDQGFPVEVPRSFTPAQVARYSRQLILPEVGEKGQAALLDAKVLLVGAGGLGSAAAYYLAAAGVGTLGIVDHGLVDESNLRRQILHDSRHLGALRAISAKENLEALNPDVRVVPHALELTDENALALLQGYDLAVDGSNDLATGQLLGETCVLLDKPLVHGSIHRFEGRVTVLLPGRSPCYRCLSPDAPAAEILPAGAEEGGVLGVLPGIVGVLQAAEAIKIILGKGAPLAGRLLLYDALGASFRERELSPDPSCPACGQGSQAQERGNVLASSGAGST
jgi:molybdopterin/thiamine biosynthesis adenylyltransferase/rhodanese-related sulfurtransferase